MGLVVEVRTADGAVDAVTAGELVRWNDRFDAQDDEDPADRLIGQAFANLMDVTGSLRLFPDTEHLEPAPAQYPNTPYSGVLAVSYDFENGALEVRISPEVWLQDSEMGIWYKPLKGLSEGADD